MSPIAMIDREISTLPDTVNGRRTMRSVADAIDRLRLDGRFSDHSLAQIRTQPIRLPGGKITSIVLVIGEPRPGEPNRGVALPSSEFVTARTIEGDSVKIETSRLDRARVNNAGQVELLDGPLLYAVNVIPTPMRYELTEDQKLILFWTIKFTGPKAEERCYRSFPEIPDQKWLDFDQIQKLELPKLEAIVQFIWDSDPRLKPTRQTVANALAAAGARRPRSGPLAA